MEAKMNLSSHKHSEKDFHDFIMEGWLEAHSGNLLDFDEVFDDLERRYHAEISISD